MKVSELIYHLAKWHPDTPVLANVTGIAQELKPEEFDNVAWAGIDYVDTPSKEDTLAEDGGLVLIGIGDIEVT